jgi:hypothetical protein
MGLEIVLTLVYMSFLQHKFLMPKYWIMGPIITHKCIVHIETNPLCIMEWSSPAHYVG